MPRGQIIESHYRAVWGVEGIPCLFPFGPFRSLPEDFLVLKFPPSAERNAWVYATRCMSQPEDESPVELHMFSSADALELIELMYMTAYFHRTAAHLNLGHSVNFGKPWLPGSDCDHGLISLPYLDGPKLEILDRSGTNARCYWLIPITASEVAFKRAHGLDALEERFEQAQFNYLDPGRGAVA